MRRSVKALSHIVRQFDIEHASSRPPESKEKYQRARSTSRIKSKLLANQKYTARTLKDMERAGLVTRREGNNFNYYDPTQAGRSFLEKNSPLLDELEKAYWMYDRARRKED